MVTEELQHALLAVYLPFERLRMVSHASSTVRCTSKCMVAFRRLHNPRERVAGHAVGRLPINLQAAACTALVELEVERRLGGQYALHVLRPANRITLLYVTEPDPSLMMISSMTNPLVALSFILRRLQPQQSSKERPACFISHAR